MVNPHDITFLNTDRPGEQVQAGRILGHIRPEPADPLYEKQWQFELPQTYTQAVDAPGRPAAHKDFTRSHDGLVGNIPNEDRRWKRRHNYYLNCLRDVDRNIASLLDELDNLGFASNTIIVLTADHGDLDGAHGLHSKGATSYREQNNVPLIVVHPAYQGGKRCKTLTSHLDLAPTLINLTGATAEKKASITKSLPGKDFSKVLAAPDKSGTDAIRDGMLFCYNMFACLDGDFMAKVLATVAQGGKAKLVEAAKSPDFRPDMRKRGAIRSVFDGRYQFTRYYSPKQHNKPGSIEDLFKLNDVELFDFEKDPLEVDNLAMDQKKKLPGGVDAGWVATDAVKDV
jgi:arylsulfatase